jgi:hypothetical protein
MIHQLSYVLHMLSTIVFVSLLALPWMIRNLPQRSHEEFLRSLKIWRIITHAANLFLIVTLITGIAMATSYLSTWFWLVMIVFLAMGAFLGIVAKSLRLVMEASAQKRAFDQPLKKLTRFSNWLAFSIIVMIFLMYVRW